MGRVTLKAQKACRRADRLSGHEEMARSVGFVLGCVEADVCDQCASGGGTGPLAVPIAAAARCTVPAACESFFQLLLVL